MCGDRWVQYDGRHRRFQDRTARREVVRRRSGRRRNDQPVSAVARNGPAVDVDPDRRDAGQVRLRENRVVDDPEAPWGALISVTVTASLRFSSIAVPGEAFLQHGFVGVRWTARQKPERADVDPQDGNTGGRESRYGKQGAVAPERDDEVDELRYLRSWDPGLRVFAPRPTPDRGPR